MSNPTPNVRPQYNLMLIPLQPIMLIQVLANANPGATQVQSNANTVQPNANISAT